MRFLWEGKSETLKLQWLGEWVEGSDVMMEGEGRGGGEDKETRYIKSDF